MPVLMLLANCPMDELTVYAAESERSLTMETDAVETVTIYKGGAYAYGGETSNGYSTDEAPESTNVNAYGIVSDYAEETYYCDSSRVLMKEEKSAFESLKTCISVLPAPIENFQVCLISDETTENEYDLIFWRI